MLGPFATASRRTPHYHSPGVVTVASHAACASMSTTTTTTTTTTTRDRGDRYGPMEWAQQPSNTIIVIAMAHVHDETDMSREAATDVSKMKNALLIPQFKTFIDGGIMQIYL